MYNVRPLLDAQILYEARGLFAHLNVARGESTGRLMSHYNEENMVGIWRINDSSNSSAMFLRYFHGVVI